MNTVAPLPLIRRRLVQARQRYNWLRLLQHGGTFIAVSGLLWFALLFSVARSWLTSRQVYQTLAGSGVLLFLAVGFGLLCATLTRRRQAAFLAAAVEGARPALQDRLNTLVFLDRPDNARARRFFAPAIAGQATPALGSRAAGPLYPRARAWAHFGVGLACVAGTYWFADRYHPLRNLVSGSPVSAKVQPPDAPFELDAKNTAGIAGKNAWG